MITMLLLLLMVLLLLLVLLLVLVLVVLVSGRYCNVGIDVMVRDNGFGKGSR